MAVKQKTVLTMTTQRLMTLIIYAVVSIDACMVFSLS